MFGLPAVSGGGGAGAPLVGSGGTPATAPSGSGGAPAASGTSSSGGMPAPVMTAAVPSAYPYDRGVQFDWPATTPMAGKCQPGTYTGTFSCDIDQGFFGKITYSGPVSFTLTASPSGEFLEISNGTLTLNANGIPAMSDLHGKLDCATNELTAMTENGMFTIFIFMGAFVGTLEGHLDRLSETLSGSWTLVPDLGAGGTPSGGGAAGAAAVAPYTCTGPWSVVRQ